MFRYDLALVKFSKIEFSDIIEFLLYDRCFEQHNMDWNLFYPPGWNALKLKYFC
jgi:hypothetical protein